MKRQALLAWVVFLASCEAGQSECELISFSSGAFGQSEMDLIVDRKKGINFCDSEYYLIMNWSDVDGVRRAAIELDFSKLNGQPLSNTVAQASFEQRVSGAWDFVAFETIAERIPAVRRAGAPVADCGPSTGLMSQTPSHP